MMVKVLKDCDVLSVSVVDIHCVSTTVLLPSMFATKLVQYLLNSWLTFLASC